MTECYWSEFSTRPGYFPRQSKRDIHFYCTDEIVPEVLDYSLRLARTNGEFTGIAEIKMADDNVWRPLCIQTQQVGI